ncbi:MAG: sigma-E processing peptidase SpoIIGA [Lachnospiraceae bacterium]|nr:sigma-E processing peptidase SpoIIGA [Lachnospiraceae bacterium]
MQYTIYIDVLFYKLFILSFVLLWSAGMWNRASMKLWKISIGAAVWSIISIASLMLPQEIRLVAGFMLQCFLGLVVLTLVFGKTNWISFVFIALYYSGIFRMLDWLQPMLGKAGAQLCILTIALVIFAFSLKRGRENKYVTVSLHTGDETLEIKALVDSGNSLSEPLSGKPACVLEKDCLPENWQPEEPYCSPGIFFIPYRAVGTEEGLLQGICFKNAKVKADNKTMLCKEMMVALCEQKLSKNGAYRMLLHEDYRPD